MTAPDVIPPRPSTDSLRVVFGSTERRGAWALPQQLAVRVWFGNVELDLREATLPPGTTTIDLGVRFGHVELTVPPELDVELQLASVLANVEDTRRSRDQVPAEPAPSQPYRTPVAPPRPRLRITGGVTLGNCEVIALERGQTRADLIRQQRRERHLRHRERHLLHRERHRARVAAWQAERELWQGEGRRWLPWWMQAHMRRRIFLWFGFALAIGTFAGTRFESGHPHWWIIPGLIVLWAVSGAVAWRMTRPLILAVKAARDIGDGKLDTRLDGRAGGEMKVLADAINEMAARIEQQIKDQRQLLAAVSHELRTPLGHMRVLIDTARDSSREQPVAGTTNGKALDELEREVLTLDDLVGRLLAQSRLEFGNLDRRELDLGELVSDAAVSAGVDPDAISATGDVCVSADPTLVRRALANLLDNARTHGGGAVAVRVERHTDHVVIEVDDAGPGVPTERRADAFRAFVPSAGGGLGLGLALVARIAKAHDGKAWITERPSGGARVGFSIGA